MNLSPFRYPGGKTWLIPLVRRWLASIPRPAVFCEPFAGGASIGLTVAAEDLAARVVLVEKDSGVAAVWKTIFHGAWGPLCEMVKRFNCYPSDVKYVVEKMPSSAFRTLLLNRCSHGGLIGPDARLMVRGENGNGVASRWYAGTLAKRIEYLAGLRGRVTALHGCGLEFMRSKADDSNRVWYIDPPVSVPRRRLYDHDTIDMDEVFTTADELRGPWLMTVPDSPAARELAARHSFVCGGVTSWCSHNAKKSELLVGRDLTWAIGPMNSEPPINTTSTIQTGCV
jgi:DNA adenine methylase